MAVFSGFVGFDHGYPEMYEFEINHTVDFFDPAAFDRANPARAWRTVDVRTLPNSPFSTLINPDFVPDDGVACDERCIRANQRDAFKLYPENYLMPDGRIYLTREGDWVSLRTESTAFMRRTTHTYWMDVGGTAAAPTVSFERGPERPDTITSYGTTYLDPNTGNITLLGGQPTSPGILLPMQATTQMDHGPPTHYAGGRGRTSASASPRSWTGTPPLREAHASPSSPPSPQGHPERRRAPGVSSSHPTLPAVTPCFVGPPFFCSAPVSCSCRSRRRVPRSPAPFPAWMDNACDSAPTPWPSC